MRNSDMKMHVRGKSQYIDDLPVREGLLHAVIFTSPVSKGKLKKVDISKAQEADGVVAVFTAEDVPGENQVGHIIRDQPLLAVDSVEFIGQPIALVVAETRKQAADAVKLIRADIDVLEPVTDPRKAFENGDIYGSQRIMQLGDTDAVWKKCCYIIEGQAESAGQEHFYFETQSSLSEPVEGGNIKVIASSQAPGGFQQHIAEVLGLPMHKVEFEIRRLGGGFGGKEGCAVWTVLSAMAAKILNRPVKLVLSRTEDIATSGKRHPYSSDYKIGLDKEYKILAYEADMYQSGGAFSDLSLAVLGRTILHTTNSYNIPNVKVRAVSCKTNINPNTAFRGFGVPQAVFLMESAIYAAAEKIGIDPSKIQRNNLLREGDEFPYGMIAENCTAERCWDTLNEKYDIAKRIDNIKNFNKKNTDRKKGIYIMPVCFGISFVQTAMNQAGSLVHIYIDGSVGISTGAVEMGQGVNMKILLIAAKEFSISPDLIKVETTNTTRVANASPTSASTGADLNGMATQIACKELIERLKKVAADKLGHQNHDDIKIVDGIIHIKDKATEYTWFNLIKDTYAVRQDLSCHAFYAPPGLHFDVETQKGKPYAYHSFGSSITEVTLDCIRGTYDIDSVDVVHDIGISLNVNIDKGQFEGGIIQGIGWSTIENLVYAEDGRLLSTINSYKIPDIKFIPKNFNINFLENVMNPYAVSNSKAVGEPPFIHGIASYFALLNALRAARKDKELLLSLPMTPEKAFMYLYE